MKIISVDDSKPTPRLPLTIRPNKRSPETLGATRNRTACLFCPDEPCRSYSKGSRDEAGNSRVCPVDAISEIKKQSGPTFAETCIGCGICALRCPVGAISVEGSMASVDIDLERFQSVKPDEKFFESRSRLHARSDWTELQISEVAERLAEQASELTQSDFYPLVERLFRALEFESWLPPRGDTSNRIDLLIYNDGVAIPVEIKSRTETTVINLKGVQQALENRIVLDQRHEKFSNPTFTSLVVGYEYAPDRSDVTELVTNIWDAFGIRIGMVSLKTLYELVLKKYSADEFDPRAILSNLYGTLR